VQLVASIAYILLLLYTLLLLARLVLEWIQSFARRYRPTGVVLILFEVVYTLTDPPVKGLRRVIPPLRLGAVSLDLSLLILLLAGSLLMGLMASLAV
jgi:YggT family protein